MNTIQKAKILTESSFYDSCGPKACEVRLNKGLGGIYHAKSEHKTCKIFKTLMDNSCSFDCSYCANSKHSCNKQKASYEPEELASLFKTIVNKRIAEGLFLSSGIPKDPDEVVEKMLSAVKIIRHKQHFRGYIHFKILPVTSKELIKQAAELSSRMSINLEAPNSSSLSEVSSCKDYKIDILRRQAWISRLNLSGGQTTQIIVNNISTDKDILKMTKWEYEAFKLRRMYFSAFKPVKGTPMK